MRKFIVFAALFTFLFFSAIQYLVADNVFLKKIAVEGNRITKTSYIMKNVDLIPGKIYNVDNLMEKMSEIKSKLLDTGLFESLYFDDQS